MKYPVKSLCIGITLCIIFPISAKGEIKPAKKYPKYESNKLLVENQMQLKKLKVVVKNFGSAEHRSGLKKAIRQFHEAASVHYSANYDSSLKLLGENKTAIQTIYKDLSVRYRSRCEILLNRLQEKLVRGDLNGPIEITDEQAMVKSLGQDTLEIARRNFNHGYELYKEGKYSRSLGYYRMVKVVLVYYLIDHQEIEHIGMVGEYKRDIEDAREQMFSKF